MSGRAVLAMIGTAVLISCANRGFRHSWDYKDLAAHPTPRDWKAGTVWTFVTTTKAGASETITFRVTGEIVKTCSSGTWRKLRVINGRAPKIMGEPTQPAFTIEGSFLWIDLNAPWCDIDDHIRGGLEGTTFTGDRTQGGPMGSHLIGSVRGWRVK
jgi:hypothetical protein